MVARTKKSHPKQAQNPQNSKIHNIELFKILKQKAENHSPDSITTGKEHSEKSKLLSKQHYDYKYWQE